MNPILNSTPRRRRPLARPLGAIGVALLASAASAQVTMNHSITSTGAQDGYLTSLPTATSNDTGNAGIRLGDNALGSRVRGMTSFDTSVVPSNATYLDADLQITRGAQAGNPTGFVPAFMEIKRGAFNNNVNLETADYGAAPDGGNSTVSPLAIPGSNGASTVSSLSNILTHVNRQGGPNGGITQIRLHYNGASTGNFTTDHTGIQPGEAATASSRPLLLLEFTDPNIVNVVSPIVSQDIAAGSLVFTVSFDVDGASPVGYTVNSVTPSGADAGEFVVSSGATGSVVAGGTHSIGLDWDPSVVGPKTASLSVATNRGTFVIALNATATAATPSPSPSPSASPSPSPSPSPTASPTASPTVSPTASPSPSPSASPTPSPTVSPTASPSASPSPSPTESPSPSPSPSPTESPTASPSASPTPSPSPTGPTPSPTESPTPSPSPTPNSASDWLLYE